MTTRNFLNKIITYFKIILGTMLTAASFGLFIQPSKFCAAGVTGFSILISCMTTLPVSTLVFVFNMILLLFGFLLLGYEVIVNSIAVSLLFPIFLAFFSKINVPLDRLPPSLIILLAGSLLGCGIGIILNCNSSAGGFDLLGLILNKKLGLPIALVMNVCDSTVILLQAIGQPNVLPILYGLCVIIISNLWVAAFTGFIKPKTLANHPIPL